MRRGHLPLPNAILIGALVVLGLLSILFIVRMSQEEESTFNAVNYRSPEFDPKAADVNFRERSEAAAAPAADLMSGLEFVQRVHVPFAPVQPDPPPPPEPPAPPPDPGPDPQTIPARAARKPFVKPVLKRTGAKTHGTSSTSSSAFLAAPKEESRKAEPARGRSAAPASAAPAAGRTWRTPTGHSSTDR